MKSMVGLLFLPFSSKNTSVKSDASLCRKHRYIIYSKMRHLSLFTALGRKIQQRLQANANIQATFSNTESILKNLLTIPLPNASGERFFTVKTLKNYLRRILTSEHYSYLHTLRVAWSRLKTLDYDAVISDSTRKKSKKESFEGIICNSYFRTVHGASDEVLSLCLLCSYVAESVKRRKGLRCS
jgi:hypothetical protein